MKSCVNYAMDYLYKYPKTESEIKIHLLKKGYDEDEVNLTIEKIKYLGYIDDKKYVEMFLQSQCINHGKPIRLVESKLRQKGISKSLIYEVYNSLGEDASKALENKILREIESYKSKGVEGFDIIQKLMRKGYNIKDIKNTLKIGH